MTELEQNKRLEYLIKDVFKMSVLDFFSRYNDTKGVKTYNILRGRNGISNKMLDAIVSSYPDLNIDWVRTGEGEMLNNAIYTDRIDRLLSIIEEKDRQINRLLAIIEKINKKAHIIMI